MLLVGARWVVVYFCLRVLVVCFVPVAKLSQLYGLGLEKHHAVRDYLAQNQTHSKSHCSLIVPQKLRSSTRQRGARNQKSPSLFYLSLRHQMLI